MVVLGYFRQVAAVIASVMFLCYIVFGLLLCYVIVGVIVVILIPDVVVDVLIRIVFYFVWCSF